MKGSENYIKNTETSDESEWSNLEELDKGSFSGERGFKDKDEEKPKTAEEKREELSRVAEQVREAYQKKSENETRSLVALEQPSQEVANKEVGISSWAKSIADGYAKTERTRVDKIKSDLYRHINVAVIKKKQIAVQPGIFKQAARLAMDKIGIKLQSSEDRRNREAMHVALNEYDEEKRAEEKTLEERQWLESRQEEERVATIKAERDQQERALLLKGMAKGHDVASRSKSERFRRQRIQEIVEKDLNARTLKVEDLEAEVLSGDPEVKKREMAFGGEQIPIYDLEGRPFALLSHTVDYRKSDNPIFEIGQETYRKIMEDPAVWAERLDVAEQKSGFGTRDSDARGDTISASFRDSEKNIDSYFPGDLIYGFEQVEADSVISISNGDGGTSNMAGKDETALNNPDILERLTGAGGTSNYNEVLLRRYSENGVPKKPDYIITVNGVINEVALKHAQFFKIPIINIEREAYEEKMEERGEKILDSISEKDNYLELAKKLDELLSMSKYKKRYHYFNAVGRKFDKPVLPYGANVLEERLFEVSKLEQHKRLEFIESALREYVSEIEQATNKGEVAPESSALIKDLYASIMDVHNQTRSNKYNDDREPAWSTAGGCSWIDIGFLLKDGGTQLVETRIYDGQRLLNAQQAIENGWMKKSDLEEADSSAYDKIEPVVRRYFEAWRENQRVNERKIDNEDKDES